MCSSEEASDLAAIAKERASTAVSGLAQELVAFASAYVQHSSVNLELGGPSVAGQEGSCQEWLARELDRWGVFEVVDTWAIDAGRPNVATVLRGAGDGQALLLNGHSDVVPAPEELIDTWLVPPWSGAVVDGCLFGRGACDMKGPNASFLMAARAMREAGIQLKGDVICTAVVGEESGNRHVGCDSILDRGYRAPLCIVAEPTNLAVIPTITGELYLRIRVRGRATHLANRPASIWPQSSSAEPPGVNAIEKMWKVLRALIELERDWGVHVHHLAMPPGAMTLNIAMIRGGEYISSLPEECEAVVSVLFAPQFRVGDVMAEIEAVVRRAAENDLWLREHLPEIQAPYVVPAKEPVDHSSDDTGYQTLCRAAASAVGREPRVAYGAFTSDANFLDERGQPCIMFGPGDLSMGTHGADEHIPVQDLIAACHAYAHMMIDWCGVSSIK